jgi:apolipoprotein N-acyltransferase
VSQAIPIGLTESEQPRVTAAELVGPEWRVADLPLLKERTPYVVLGDIPAYLASLFSVGGTLLALLRARRKRRPAEAT